MQLTKAQIEQVKYQLKKLEATATNDEVREAAKDLEEFDANSIADKVLASRTTSLTNGVEQGSVITSGLSIPTSEPVNNSLTVAQKQTLTQIQAQQLGIELSQLEITEVSTMVANEITDSIGYLQAVGEIIKQFIERRNNQASVAISEQIANIATIITTGNDQLGDIFNGANRQLQEIVSQCKQRREDYKSPYASKLEGIREILQIL